MDINLLFKELGSAGTIEFIDTAIISLSKTQQLMSQSFRNDDHESTLDYLHRLKGSSTWYGHPKLVQTIETLLNHLKHNQKISKKQFQELIDCVEQVQHNLKKIKNDMQSNKTN